MVIFFYSTCIWKMGKVNEYSKGIGLGNIFKIFLMKKEKKIDFLLFF